MSAIVKRGALIVMEGCDRCGKTTQCKRLVESLNSDGVKSVMWRFPDRTSSIGKMINDYLGEKADLEDHVVHLLFTANRWEAVPKMKELLESGTTLVVDRYSYSGVAFSAAKQGMSLGWCRQPEVGLPKPDAVLYLTLSTDEAAKRATFGVERYENEDFQARVARNFDLLKEDDWKIFEANKSIDDLHTEIKEVAKQIVEKFQHKPLEKLWTDDNIKSPKRRRLIDTVTTNLKNGESPLHEEKCPSKEKIKDNESLPKEN